MTIDSLPDLLRERLYPHTSGMEADQSSTPAAVLIPLFQDDEVWHLLFTRRTHTVDSHPGQVAFPGGAIEDQDLDAFQAALREAEEEIGIQPQDVQVLGALDPLATVSQFTVLPIVGIIPWPYTLRLNHREVASVFGVPMAWLADPNNLEIRPWPPPPDGPVKEVHFFRPYEDEVIWGATAKITLRLLSLLDFPIKE